MRSSSICSTAIAGALCILFVGARLQGEVTASTQPQELLSSTQPAPTTGPAFPEQPARLGLEGDDVVFMHGTPDWSLYKTYGATVIAWGGVTNSLAEVRQLHAMGIITTGAANALTAGAKALHDNPDLQEATVRDIEGNPIIVPWESDRFYQNVPTWWGCSNHPSFRAFMRARVAETMAGGADGLHVDDPLGTANPAMYFGGCFCDSCMLCFRQWLKTHSTPELLAAAKVSSFDRFDYRDLVKQYATTKAAYLKVQNQIPLHQEFLDFQLQAAAENVRELGEEAAGVVHHRVSLSSNTGLPSLPDIEATPVLDYLVGEVKQNATKGTSALGNAIAGYRMAEALCKPMASTAIGRDWFYVKEHKSENLVKVWIALSYACGQHLMVPVRAYTYSEKTGAGRYDGPPEVFAPLYQFVRKNPRLFRDLKAVGPLAVPKDLPMVFDTGEQRKAFEAALAAGSQKVMKAGDWVSVFPREGKDAAVVHLLNLQYDGSTDLLTPQKNVVVRLRSDLFSKRFSQVTLYEPSAEPVKLELTNDGADMVVTVPEVSQWSVLLLE